MEYFSDASRTSESSDDEDDIHDVPVYCHREIQYWRIENVLERRSAPEIVSYTLKIGAVAIRECVVLPICHDMSIAMPPKVVSHWQRYTQGKTEVLTSQISNEEWDALGEFCMELCECCGVEPTFERIHSCMIRLLAEGPFLQQSQRQSYQVSLA